MAKSTRFRNRKINFKTRIAVRIGNNAVDFEEDVTGEGEGEVEFEEDKKGHGAGAGVDTGVDKEEEGEVHLQAVLASSSASVSRAAYSGNATTGTSGTRSTTNLSSAPSSPAKAAPKAFIPTPDSTGIIELELYQRLYRPGAYVDPVTNIRFSDTVEDAQVGTVGYTMDEDDEDWLEIYNRQLLSNAAGAITSSNGNGEIKPLEPSNSITNGALPSPNARSGSGRDRKGKGEKGKEKMEEKVEVIASGPMSDDQFEEVMEFFEVTTEQKAPMAHVDTSSLPTLAQMEVALAEEALVSPSLGSLKIFARSIYPHWKGRRLKRGGEGIIPQLDYDESNEQNPYVCFRRRELKTARKTRRSDAQNIDRLIRLRNDLFAAHALMIKTRDRERQKLEVLEIDKRIFEGRVEVRELKRRLGEAEGDEDLLIGKRDKKRRREEPVPGGMRVQLRKPDSAAPTTFIVASVEELKARKERAAAILQRMDREMAKKKDLDSLFEDWTDGAYIARHPPHSARFWRSVDSFSTTPTTPASTGRPKVESLVFASAYQHALGPVRTSFRRRVGRGGRVMLDRIAPGMGRKARPIPNFSDGSDEEEEVVDLAALARREERFRFDRDVAHDFPSVDEPAIVDDFASRYLLKRATLLQPSDHDTLALDGSYIEEAYRWAAAEPERNVGPPIVFGRPAPRAAPPLQPGGPGGVTLQGLAGNSSAAAGYNQMMVAANQAHRVAAAQAQLKRQAVGGTEQMRQSPTGLGSPIGQSQQPLPTPLPMPMPIPMPMAMPMSMPMNGVPIQGAWMNGMLPQKGADGMSLPAGFPNHLQQQQLLPNGVHHQQRIPAGLLAAMPNGANGLPATSGLSFPPQSLQLSAQQQQHIQQQQQQLLVQQQQQLQQQHLQQQQQQLQHPNSSPLLQAHPQQLQRPLSAQGGISRPSSAQSQNSHQSPSLITQGLPGRQNHPYGFVS